MAHYVKDDKECKLLPYQDEERKLRLTHFQFLLLDLNCLCWSLWGTFMFIQYLIYRAEHPFFEQYKVQKDKPWPWK